ncbi:MAG TPA: hypothetical protein VMA98_12165 [Candidatus Acidoferrales bacterium]|nr:hypothetical protein [Candidatus Acidoferrales bacterium]
MTTRKDFLVAGTLAAAAIPATALADAPAQKLDFDLAAFTKLLNGPQAHKHLFASIEINGGEVFSAMRNTLNAYKDIGIAWSEVFPVAVLYHGVSILMAFDDTIWNRYVIPYSEQLRPNHGGYNQIMSIHKAGSAGNPVLVKQSGAWDTSIPSLVADAGAYFFVCDNAAHGMAKAIGAALNKQPDAVYGDLSQHLVANAQLVPAGVWAVHAIQEQRFTLLQTSLYPNA